MRARCPIMMEALSLADSETALVIGRILRFSMRKRAILRRRWNSLRSARQPVRTHRRCRRKSVFWKAGKYWR